MIAFLTNSRINDDTDKTLGHTSYRKNLKYLR